MSGATTFTKAELEQKGFRVENGRAIRIGPREEPTTRDTATASSPPLREPWRSKIERLYAKQLELQRAAGEIRSWDYEALTFLLATGLRYKADWLVVTRTGEIQIHETKGRRRTAQLERGMAKLRVAARLYPAFAFFKVTHEGGRFVLTRIAA